MPDLPTNLLSDLPAPDATEHVDTLVTLAGMRIERIVSTGQASPPDFWYDQDGPEWVLVLSGSAGLLIAGEAAPRRLIAGDYALIPAHVRHRVEWTDPTVPTVWLAVHGGG
jgi:cupin 2 domain-containing protein